MSVYARLDDAIMYLIHELDVDVVQVINQVETYEYLHTSCRVLAESVYRKKVTDLDCVVKRCVGVIIMTFYMHNVSCSVPDMHR